MPDPLVWTLVALGGSLLGFVVCAIVTGMSSTELERRLRFARRALTRIAKGAADPEAVALEALELDQALTDGKASSDALD